MGAQDDGDPAQHLVTDTVRVVVVDLFELVDIHEDCGELLPALVDGAGHHLPVSQARERVE